MAAPRPWADLHTDMVLEIFRRVPCAIDRGNMAAACHSWLAELTDDAPEAPPRLPSLLLPSGDATGVHCYLSGCRDHNKFTAITGPRHFGSYGGSWSFLAYGQTHGHRLLNVRTGESHAVPDVLADDHDDDQIHSMVILAATLSFPPDHMNCVAAGIVTYQPDADAPRRRHFAFWRLGGEVASCNVVPDVAVGHGLELEDVVYHRDCFHFLSHGEDILECTLVLGGDGDVLGVVADLIRFQNAGRSRSYDEFVRARYLVASRGELLMVVRFAPDPHAPTSSFKVFQMLEQQMPKGDNKEEADEYPRRRSQLDTLGGRMLFVGRACSRSYEVASIGITIPVTRSPLEIVRRIKLQLGVPFFMEIIVLMSWSIWIIRNDWMFNQIHPTVDGCKRKFIAEFRLVLLRAKPSLLPAMESWLENL